MVTSTSSSPTTSTSTSRRRHCRSPGLCRYKGLPVACGPPGLPGATNLLYRNRGDGTFEDVSQQIRHRAWRAARTAWASRHSTSTMTDGSTCTSPTTRSQARSIGTTGTAPSPTSPSKPAARSARTAGRRPAWASPSATTTGTARWTSSAPTSPVTRPRSTPTAGDGDCEDRTFAAGIGINTRWLGWGVGFLDLERDGWPDLFLVNGHVYPEVSALAGEAGIRPAQGRLPQSRQRQVRRRHRPPRATRDDTRGQPWRGVRRPRQRRRRRRGGQQHARAAGSVPSRHRVRARAAG